MEFFEGTPTSEPTAFDSGQTIVYSPFNATITSAAVDSNATAAESEGWHTGKGENFTAGSGAGNWQNGGVGSIFTLDESTFRANTNYQSTIPGIDTVSRIGCLTTDNEVSQVQTDHYFDLNDTGNPNAILPPDVWFQFWIYPNRYGSEMSEFQTRVGKWLYPCLGGHGSCTTMSWLLYFFGHGYPSATDGLDLLIRDPGSSTGISLSYNGDANILHSDNSEWIKPNRWNFVKIHINSGNAETGNQIEAWIRGLGGSDTKVMDYYAHTDTAQRLPDSSFVYQIPNATYRQGHDNFRLGTTFPGNVSPSDSRDMWLYLKDFVIADAENKLPVYSSY